MNDRVVGRVASFAALVTLAACQPGPAAPTPTRNGPASPAIVGATSADLAASRGGFVSSTDPAGAPQFLWATPARPSLPGLSAADAARAHLSWFAPALGLDAPTVRSAELVRVHDLGHGPVIAWLHQRIDGADVYRSDVKVLMKQDLSLVAISGNLKPPELVRTAAHTRFAVAPRTALSLAVADVLGVTLPTSELVEVRAENPDDLRFQLAASDKVQLSGDARLKRLFFPEGARLVPAWSVELFAGLPGANDTEARRIIVSAEDGRVLDRRDLTASDAFKYRIWVDANNRPLDGPQADYTPHPTGLPDGSQPAFIAPTLVPMDGFNHNPAGKGDPWLSTNAVQSLGNNVDAYSDTLAPDGYSNGDIRATTTAAKTFDRTYDTAGTPFVNQGQTMASITTVFYLMNWMHDWYYDSGFNEAGGNAQTNNFGRGGAGGDELHAELQDSYPTQKNNANMSTPADGLSPRMQMYVWSGEETRKLTLPSGDVTSGSASYGPTNFNLTGDVVLGAPADGCAALTGTVTGSIVLVDRGTCGFAVKTKNAQTAGAIAVLIANNVAGAGAPGMSGTDATITIPTLSVSLEDGAALKTAIGAGPVSATFFRLVGVERDGGLDNTVVAHEWGHYLHHRLADCGSGQCGAMSEGWADFNALVLLLRDGDNLDGVFPVSVYASRAFGDSGYYGIRRFPYSVDPTKNALSLRHIATGEALPATPVQNNGIANSEVHNAGEVWASMMFEVYVSLQKARGPLTFEEMHRRMSDYVVAGLQLSPPDATYTEQRDSVLAAIAAANQDHLHTAAEAFARRGSGTCAKVPDRYSPDFVGVTESSELKPILVLGDVKIDDSVHTCDQDGILDGDERGHLTLTVANAGSVAMGDTQVVVSTTSPGITFPGGNIVNMQTIPAFGSSTITVDVAVDPQLKTQEIMGLKIQVTNPTACTGLVERTLAAVVNADEKMAMSATDPVESSKPAWKPTGTGGDLLWARTEVALADHAWVGTDADGASDTQLVSPDLKVGTSAPLVIAFDHKFSFEADAKPTWFDGGVIELSADGGTTWTDAATLTTPDYGGALATGNALVGRQAFVGKNPAWPMRDHVELQLGTSFAGQTVKLRFRIVTDAGTGDYGWEIDNLAVTGITNTPFSGLVPDGSVCSLACPAGLSACGNACTYLPTDPANCGACGNACPEGQLCAQGQCALTCQDGLTACNGACVSLGADRGNCGACGNACAAGQVCSSGVCTLSCQESLTDCNGSCANLASDNANCGACGGSCALGSTCIAGSCEKPPGNPANPSPHGGCDYAPGSAPSLPWVILVLGLVLPGLEARRRRRVSST